MRKQLVIGYSSTIAVACLGLAFTSYYVSFFGKESYVLIALLLTIISAIQNLDGLQKPLVNEYVKASVGRRDLTDVIKSALCFSALIGLVAVVIFYLSLRFFVDNLTTYEFIYISVSGAIFIFLFFYLTPMNAFFIFANQPHLNQLWKLVVYGSLYIVFFICTKIYGDGPMLLVALGFSGFLGFLFIYSVSRNTFVPSFNVFPSISRFFRIFILGIGMNLAIFLFLFVDKIFLYGLPAADMADYLIPFELMSKFAVVHAIFGGALLGKISQYSVRSGGDFDALDYFKSAIFYVGIISVISINLVLYGKDFFNIWLGLEVTTQMIVVYYVFIVSFFLNSFGWLGFNILLLEGKLRIVTIAYIAMLVVLIVACLFLSGLLGVLGIAISISLARLMDVVLFVISIQSHLDEFIVAIKESWLPIKVLGFVLSITFLLNIFSDRFVDIPSIYSLIFGVFVFTFLCVVAHRYLSLNGHFPKKI